MVGLLLAPPLNAQVVRGVVREAIDRTVIPGVVLTLERLASDGATVSDAVSVLSDAQGAFALRATSAGRYRVAAKRIGVRRMLTEPFDLGTGETRQVTLDVEAVYHTLPEVTVATANFCIPRKEEVGRVAALWEEAKTALTATTISVRDSLYRGRILSFGRMLDGRGRVLSERIRQYEGLLSQTFTAIHPETLSVYGYWREEDDSVRFDAPDVDVLLSESFLRDHCFELAKATDAEVGVHFEPESRRSVGGVSGTMWLDTRTFELRRLEFTYTRLPRVERPDLIGGEVHFARLSTGAWVVRRWSIRAPQFARLSLNRREYIRRYERPDPSTMRVTRAARVIANRMVENGGIAYVDHLRSFEKPAGIRGVAMDSAGKPLSQGRIRLAGTQFGTPVDPDGHFKMDSIPPGIYRIEAITDSIEPLGIADANQEIDVRPGDEKSVTLRADGVDGLLVRLCGGRSVPKERTALRVVLIDSLTNRPDYGTAMRLWWTEYVRERGVNRVIRQQLESSTDSYGSIVFCGLPIDVPLELGLALGADRAQRLETLQIPSRLPVAKTVRRN